MDTLGAIGSFIMTPLYYVISFVLVIVSLVLRARPRARQNVSAYYYG